jgi:hypothetical protein
MTDCFLVSPQDSAQLRTIDAIKLLVRHGMMVSSAIPGRRYQPLDSSSPVMIAVSVQRVCPRHGGGRNHRTVRRGGGDGPEIDARPYTSWYPFAAGSKEKPRRPFRGRRHSP